MEIRKANFKDVKKITSSMQALFDFHFDLTGDEKYKVKIDETHIEESLDSLIYYVVGEAFIRGNDKTILDLWVPVRDRKKGYARKLVEKFIENKKDISVLLDSRNEGALLFWQKFQQVKIINSGEKH